MKLARRVIDMFEKQYQAEAGDTSSSEDGHWHKTAIDISGNGKTLETLPKGSDSHTHIIKDFEATDSGNGHTHKVVA